MRKNHPKGAGRHLPLDNELPKQVMERQVLHLAKLGIVDTSFIGQDATPVMANTCQNNPKSFREGKFSKENQPKADRDCQLGVHPASNQHSDKNYEFYWGYKNHVLCDVITGLPLFEMTTVTEEMLRKMDTFLSIRECCFIGDAAFDVKSIYNITMMSLAASVLSPLTQETPRTRRSCLPETPSARLVLP